MISFPVSKQHNAALKILKREIDQFRVALDAKYLELESQAKDLKKQAQDQIRLERGTWSVVSGSRTAH
jgi:hypothetical protein